MTSSYSQELLLQHVQAADGQGPSLHVWAGISLHRRTQLMFLDRNVNAATYAAQLQTHIRPFMETELNGTENSILQDDNAPPHRPTHVEMGLVHLQLVHVVGEAPGCNWKSLFSWSTAYFFSLASKAF